MTKKTIRQEKSKNGLERRNYEFEVRADENDDNGTFISGRPIVYESKTDLGYFDETIARGALDDTDLTDVRFLVNHNIDMIPLARSRKNNKNSSMQLTVDDDGLGIRVNLDTENNSEARNLYSAVKRGDITGMSFMFSIDEEEWTGEETDHPSRTINKIGTVVEVSAVTFPAYEETEISARAKEMVETVLKRSVDTDPDKPPVDTGRSDDDIELLKAKARNNSILV